MKGKIKKVTDRGYGFISPEGQGEGAKDLFFHAKDLEDVMFDELREGDDVTFEVEQTEKGSNAVKVTRA